MHIPTFAAAAAFAALASTAALAEAPTTGTTSDGPALVDGKGMTLYVFDKDTAGKSNCNGQCATNWPPAKASASDEAGGDFTLVKRDDGSSQWAIRANRSTRGRTTRKRAMPPAARLSAGTSRNSNVRAILSACFIESPSCHYAAAT